MSCSNLSALSSRRTRLTSRNLAASTSYVSSPTAEGMRLSASLKRASTCSASLSGAAVMYVSSAGYGVGAADLLLQLDDSVEQLLGAGRAPRHVDVDGHDAVAAAHHRVGIVVVTAAVGAGTHGDD